MAVLLLLLCVAGGQGFHPLPRVPSSGYEDYHGKSNAGYQRFPEVSGTKFQQHPEVANIRYHALPGVSRYPGVPDASYQETQTYPNAAGRNQYNQGNQRNGPYITPERRPEVFSIPRKSNQTNTGHYRLPHKNAQYERPREEQTEQNEPEERGSVILEPFTAEEGEDGRRCVNKVMMVEETEYDEVLTCDHSYDNRWEVGRVI